MINDMIIENYCKLSIAACHCTFYLAPIHLIRHVKERIEGFMLQCEGQSVGKSLQLLSHKFCIVTTLSGIFTLCADTVVLYKDYKELFVCVYVLTCKLTEWTH